MGILDNAKDKADKIIEKVKAVKGDEGVDSYFYRVEEYENEDKASKVFNDQKRKFLNIDDWTKLSDIENLSFSHYDEAGNKIAREAKVKDFIKIDLPGPVPTNWVQIDNLQSLPDKVEISLRPSYDPTEKPPKKDVTAHFFDRETVNNLSFERKDNRLIAEVRGVSEVVNNQGKESGDKSFINTTIALGGWAGLQEKQWNSFTKSLTSTER